jgi:hypothetical protein
MHEILSSLAVVAALSAAGLWFYASIIPVPNRARNALNVCTSISNGFAHAHRESPSV